METEPGERDHRTGHDGDFEQLFVSQSGSVNWEKRQPAGSHQSQRGIVGGDGAILCAE